MHFPKIPDLSPDQVSSMISGEVRAEMARRSPNLTNAQVAAKLGKPGDWLARRLRGEVRWIVDEVDSVARALGVPVEQLWRDQWRPPTTPEATG